MNNINPDYKAGWRACLEYQKQEQLVRTTWYGCGASVACLGLLATGCALTMAARFGWGNQELEWLLLGGVTMLLLGAPLHVIERRKYKRRWAEFQASWLGRLPNA